MIIAALKNLCLFWHRQAMGSVNFVELLISAQLAATASIEISFLRAVGGCLQNL